VFARHDLTGVLEERRKHLQWMFLEPGPSASTVQLARLQVQGSVVEAEYPRAHSDLVSGQR
jgi:hypothetical protein